MIVIEAEGLEAKDINGYSDPYCMLGIRPREVICKPTPLDDGGIYCGEDSDDAMDRNEEVPEVTIVKGWDATEPKIRYYNLLSSGFTMWCRVLIFLMCTFA